MKDLSSRRMKSPRHSRGRSRRLATYFEALEERVLLSTVTVIANVADIGMHSNGTTDWIGNTSIRSGDNGTNANEMNAVFPFQLPTVPSGAVITSAILTMNLQSIGNYASIVGPDDLYAISNRASATVLSTDYFEGAYGTSTDTAIQQSFATKTTALGAVTTNSTGDANLTSFLGSQYAAGGQGNYIFLRLNAESDQLTSRFWVWYSANATTGLQPSLQFTYSTTVAPPTNLTTVTNPGTAINLTWTNNAITSTNVVVQRSTNGTTFSTIATLAPTANSYLDSTGLSADTQYYYRVYAENGSTNSTYSNVAVDSTLPTFSYQTIWVDGTHGLDTNAGSFTAPFKTITAALNSTAVKGHPAGTGIIVRSGTYTESNKSLVMPSGTTGSPFTLMGEPTEQVVVSGFKQITGWALYSGSIYSTTINWNPTTLYVNSSPQAISRSPDASWWTIPATFTQNADGTTTITDPTHLAGIGNVVGGYMQMYSTASNIPYSAKITAQDSVNGSITFTGLSAVGAGQYYSLTDALSLINNPGEWASVDNGNGTYTVYFQPASVGDLSNTQAQNTAGREIQVMSSAHDVTIRNLEITGSLGNGVDIEGSQTTLGGNVTVRNNIIDNNGGDGVNTRFENNITIENNTFRADLNGIGIASTTNSLVNANDIGFDATDGIDLTGDWRGPGYPTGFVPTSNVTISNNYIHDHLGWGHCDGIQIFSWVDSATITGNFIYNNGQGLMSENVDDSVTNNVPDTNWSTLSNNVFLDTGAYTVIFGHGNSFNWNVTNNTIGGAGYGPFSFTATGYNVSQNIIIGKEGMTSASANIYTGDYNFYYSPTSQYFLATSSPSWVNYNAITNAGHTGFYDKQGQDQHSQFSAAPASGSPLPASPFVNGPLIGTMSSATLWPQDTTTTVYLNSVAGMSVGDYIQVDGDGVVRKITAINTTTKTITLNVALSALPRSSSILFQDWGANSNFTLNLAATGTAATMGPTGGAVGSTLNVQNIMSGDYNGDGIRDYPAVPAAVVAGLPPLVGWPVPNFSVVGP